MDLALTDQQEALVASFGELLAKHASPERVRAAEPLGFDRALWDALGDVGAIEMAIPEARGGWGAGFLDLALVAERVGAAVAPAPVIEVQVAARLLASSRNGPAEETLAAVIAGEQLPTFALRPAAGGRASLVPAAAVADLAVVLDDDRLIVMRLDDAARRPVENLAAAPLADVTLSGEATEIARGQEAADAFEAALDSWFTLTAAALVGVAATAHRLVCEYARERRAWDRPIGAYQAVAHPLANDATAIDGARLLAQKAAWELGRGGPRARELAAMAFAFATETARQATYDAVHFHGGYGFMLEYDAQLYYRRGRRGWARVWGEPRAAYRRAAVARACRRTEETDND